MLNTELKHFPMHVRYACQTVFRTVAIIYLLT